MCPSNILTDPTHSFQPHLVGPKVFTHIPLHAWNFPHLNIRLFFSNSSKEPGNMQNDSSVL